ncbi:MULTISPECIES: DUF1127 domain-containing protein [unclassified Sinorhizobium]|uniref:DUF1127 domain-containing protein n=1 Tax=unclassified Sinorhizobium TaxID=2613772 RepID=UPI003525DC52
MAMQAQERPKFVRDIVREARDLLRDMAVALQYWTQKRRSRLRLLELSEDQLRDVGLTRDDVKAETSKSWFWHD